MWKKLLTRYEKVENVVAGIGLICGIGIMFIGVAARYVFNHPLTFVDEIGPIFIVWSTLTGYSIALRKDEHVKMDILYSAVKNKTVKWAMDLFGYICGLLFSVFMLQYGYLAMMMQYKMNRVTQILEVPVWISYMIIPFIGGVMIIRYIGMIVRMFKREKADNTTERDTENKEG